MRGEHVTSAGSHCNSHHLNSTGPRSARYSQRWSRRDQVRRREAPPRHAHAGIVSPSRSARVAGGEVADPDGRPHPGVDGQPRAQLLDLVPGRLRNVHSGRRRSHWPAPDYLGPRLCQVGLGLRLLRVRGLNALVATVSTSTSAPVVVAQRLRKGSCDSTRVAARLIADALKTTSALTGLAAGVHWCGQTLRSTATRWSGQR